jgi:hypothetical protein
MTRKPNITSEIVETLKEVLAQLQFSHDHADSRPNTHWVVYAQPWPGETDDAFDVLITVKPCSLAAGTGAGLRLTVERGNATWLPAGTTNQRGQVRFKALPLGSFNARLRQSAITPEVLLLKVAHFAPQAPVITHARTQVYYPDGRRLLVLLEEGRDGAAVLTVETEAPELAGGVVHFSAGPEEGDMLLRSTEVPDVWRGQARLHQDFDAVEACGPSFTVMPPQTVLE